MRYVVQTPNGWLGQRRHSYVAGGPVENDKAKFDFARVFTRKGDAENAAKGGEGWRVIPCKLVLMEE